MLVLYRPALEELWFRERMLSDPETMAYNAAWGGTIPFPREKWEKWYRDWLEAPTDRRYYRYLRDGESGRFVGEIAYYYDAERKIYICDLIVPAQYRGCGYGTAGLRLLCEAAKENGISVLYDDIAADNPSYRLFLREGFVIDDRNDAVIMVKKIL